MDAKSLGPIDVATLMKHMPHRYPMLLVDRVETCRPSSSLRAYANIGADQTYLEQYCGIPAMPPCLVLEALAQSAGILCYLSGVLKYERSIALLAGIKNCSFGAAPQPGDQVVFDCLLTRYIRNIARVTGVGLVRKETAIRAELTLAVVHS